MMVTKQGISQKLLFHLQAKYKTIHTQLKEINNTYHAEQKTTQGQRPTKLLQNGTWLLMLLLNMDKIF